MAALDRIVSVFARFWTIHRRVHRGLRAAAVRDPDLAVAMAQRNERRREGLTELVRRLPNDHEMPFARAELVQVLFVLLSFQSFNALATETRTPEQAAPVVQRIIRLLTAAP